MLVLTNLKNRGVSVFFLVYDGLNGLPQVVNGIWAPTTVQMCTTQLIRNTFRLTLRRDRDRLKREVKLMYTAPTRPQPRRHWTTRRKTGGPGIQ